MEGQEEKKAMKEAKITTQHIGPDKILDTMNGALQKMFDETKIKMTEERRKANIQELLEKVETGLKGLVLNEMKLDEKKKQSLVD